MLVIMFAATIITTGHSTSQGAACTGRRPGASPRPLYRRCCCWLLRRCACLMSPHQQTELPRGSRPGAFPLLAFPAARL